jgi:ubiquitin thioesterase OTU1
VKSGYPPRPLTIVPESPLISLGLQKGEQIIVNQKASTRGSGSQSSHNKPTIAPSQKKSVHTSPGSVDTGSVFKRTTSESGPDYVEVDGSVLVHRVRFICTPSLSRITMRRLCQMIIPAYLPLLL